MDNELRYYDTQVITGSGFPVTEDRYYDTEIDTDGPEERYYDTRITVTAMEDTYYDAVCAVPHANTDYSNLNINISANTLSDTFQMAVPQGTADLDDVIEGSIYGWGYDFAVNRTTLRNGIKEYEGRYNSNKLQRTYYQIQRDMERKTLPDKMGISVRGIMADIASRLGLTLHYNAWDWTYPLPKVKETPTYGEYKRGYYIMGGTYQAVISQLYGWLSMLPNINFSVTIRNGGLYVTQRGQEPTTYAIQTVEFPPTVARERIYTEWAGSGSDTERDLAPDQEAKEPFTGTITFGDTSLTYQDGLLVEEKRGDSTTEFTYIKMGDPEQDYLEKKETRTDDTCDKTEYTYEYIGKEIYLQREAVYTGGELNEGTPDYTNADIAITTHSPIGNGWFGHTTYDGDGEVTATSLSQGAPGNTVSKYMVDATQDNLNYRGYYQDIADLIRFLAAPIVSTSYPVMDRETILKLVDATDWLNTRIQETVTLTTVDAHIIDTTQAVTYNGNTYHVEANQITHSPQGVRQALTLKRWY